MDIAKKLLQYRYHISIATAALLLFSLLLYAAPRILSILAYFWPLFASTTVFLVSIIAFGGVSKFSDSADVEDEKAREGLLDYVAGAWPEHIDQHSKTSSE